MEPQPKSGPTTSAEARKLQGCVALIGGGGSGIGRAVAVALAENGADIAIIYLNEHADAEHTRSLVANHGRRCTLIAGDVGDEAFCCHAVDTVIDEFHKIDILVNNAAEQHPAESIDDITQAQLEKTFRTNIFGQFFLTKAAIKHLGKGASVSNTASVTAYQGSPQLLDYSATKGAIVSFTRALSNQLVPKGIRVNAVAPGPIWTPLIPSTFPPDRVEKFGEDTPMGRPGQPEEVAPSYVFLASNADSSYISGQVIHVNGGQVVES